MTMTTTQTDAQGYDLRDNYVSTFWADGPSRQYPDFFDASGDLHVYLGKVDGVAQYDCTTIYRGRTVTDEHADALRQTKRDHYSGLMVPNGSVGRSRERAEQSYGALLNRERDTARTVHPWQAQADATNHVAEDTGRARTTEDEVAVLRERAATAERQAALAAQATERVRDAHEAFKVRVREHAIEVAERQGWCDQGLGETLEYLGLPPLVRRYTMTLTVTVTVENPDDESQAVRWAESAISSKDSDVEIDAVDVLMDTVEPPED